MVAAVTCNVMANPTIIPLTRACQTNVTSLIVVLKENVTRSTAAASLPAVQDLTPLLPAGAAQPAAGVAPSPASAHLRHMYVATPRKGCGIAAALAELQQSPLVEYAEPNAYGHVCAAPNDALFNNQWSLNNVAQWYTAVVNEVQTRARGTADCDIDWLEAWNAGVPTASVVIAVSDTGIDYTHPDITNQMWHNTHEVINGFDDDGNGYIDDLLGYDFCNEDSDPMDDFGHGTHCAGLIGAATDNGIGIAGVYPRAQIMALKWLNSNGSGTVADAIRSLVYAADMGARVVNASWGFGHNWVALQDAIAYCNERGSIVVAAAGNNGNFVQTIPAGLPNVITIGATDDDDHITDFSNYGPWLSACAPGLNILSLRAKNTDMYGGGVHIVDDDYYLSDGTSMAAPLAAGAVAHLVAQQPGRAPWVYDGALQAACDNIVPRNTNYNGLIGAGRINVGRIPGLATTAVAFTHALVPAMQQQAFMILPQRLSTNVALSVATWAQPVSDVWLSVSNITPGLAFSTTHITVGDLPAYCTTNLAADALIVTVTTNAPNHYYAWFLVQTWAGTQLLAQTQPSFVVRNGNSLSVRMADLEHDGAPDFVASYVHQLYVSDSNGVLRWTYEAPIGGTFMHPAVGDVDGDGMDDIIAGLETVFGGGRLFALDHNGKMLSGWPSPAVHSYSPPTLVDLDDDGVLDIVAPALTLASSWELHAFKGNGQLLWKYVVPGGVSVTVCAAGDLDHDGWPELVCMPTPIGTITRQLIILTRHGVATNFGSAITVSGYKAGSPPVLGDLDNDGDVEIIIVGFNGYFGAYTHRIWAYHHTGTLMTGWPKDTTEMWDGYDAFPRLTDADGNGDLEIFFNGWGQGLNAWHHDGTTLSGFPVVNSNLVDQAWFADIDGDQQQEALIGWNKDIRYIETDTTLMAYKMNGTPVPGYPRTLAPIGDIYDLAAGPMGTSTWLAISGYGDVQIDAELMLLNTGAPTCAFLRTWASSFHDNANTLYCQFDTNQPFGVSFAANQTIGINGFRPTFRAVWHGAHTNGLQFLWDFNGDGTPDAQGADIPVTSAWYGAIGTYSVTLTVSNNVGQGMTCRRANYVQVIPPVSADFSANVLTANIPVRIHFTSVCTNMPQYWRWDFNSDGVVDATNEHPSFDFSMTGIYTVTLTVSNNFAVGGASSASVSKQNYLVLAGTEPQNIHYVSPYGGHIYPYKNWGEAARDVQSAVDAAAAGDSVIVTNGVYTNGVILRVHGITLRSVNGAAATTLHGLFVSNVVLMTASGATLDGFTIRNGKQVSGIGGDVNGAGINMGVGNTLRNCIIMQNGNSGTYADGGGIAMYGNCLVEHCLIISNTADYGGGIYASSVNNTIRNCVLLGNRGTAASPGSSIFLNNGMLENCLITRSAGSESVFLRGQSAVARNCTIAGNFDKQALYPFSGGAGVLANSIVYNNAIATLPANAVFSNCCLSAVATLGVANTTNAPLFINSAAGNYRVGVLSPCLDAGVAYAGAYTNDLDGLPRVSGSAVDIGCYEYQNASTLVPPAFAAPVPVLPGLSGSYDEPVAGAAILLQGTKPPNALAVLRRNYGAWSTNDILQAFAGESWSNIIVGAAYSTNVFALRTCAAGFTEIAQTSTVLRVTVAPEPGALLLAGMALLFTKRRRAPRLRRVAGPGDRAARTW
jgi:subtilisin family serine protease